MHGASSWRSPRQRRQSSVHVVVFDDLVLLVEVKSVRPTMQLRLGPKGFASELTTKPNKAFGKIDKTAVLIAARKEEFAHIPRTDGFRPLPRPLGGRRPGAAQPGSSAPGGL